MSTALPLRDRRALRGGSAAAAVVAVLLVLTGCSGLRELVPQERGGTAADPRALELAWSTPATEPSWIPADARAIRWVAATTGGADRAPAAIRLRSAAALPQGCDEAADVAAPAITAGWAPRASARTGVRRCGNWAVVAVEDGYFAWTPVAAPAS